MAQISFSQYKAIFLPCSAATPSDVKYFRTSIDLHMYSSAPAFRCGARVMVQIFFIHAFFTCNIGWLLRTGMTVESHKVDVECLNQ